MKILAQIIKPCLPPSGSVCCLVAHSVYQPANMLSAHRVRTATATAAVQKQCKHMDHLASSVFIAGDDGTFYSQAGSQFSAATAARHQLGTEQCVCVSERTCLTGRTFLSLSFSLLRFLSLLRYIPGASSQAQLAAIAALSLQSESHPLTPFKHTFRLTHTHFRWRVINATLPC